MNDIQNTNLRNYVLENVNYGRRELQWYNDNLAIEKCYKDVFKAIKGVFDSKCKLRDYCELHIDDSFIFKYTINYQKKEIEFSHFMWMESVTMSIDNVLNYDDIFLDFITGDKFKDNMVHWYLISPLKAKTSAK